MATISYSLADLEANKISSSSLEKLVGSIGMEVESIDKDEAVIDITPNRPDLLDIVGFSRALATFTGKAVPKENYYTIQNEPIASIDVGSAVKKVRPYIAAMVVRNLDLRGNRLKYLINFTEKLSDTYGRKRRKIAMGLHNFSVLKEPFAYDAANDKSFVPLGSSGKTMSFKDIMKKHRKGVQYANTVTTNNPNELYPFLTDASGVMSLIPIINSERTKVTTSTKDILIDVTGTSRNAVNSVLNMLACSFIDTEADVFPCTIINGKSAQTPELRYRELRVKKFTIEKTLGVEIGENKMIGLANKMGYPAAKYGNFLLVQVPPYRLDVLDEQDVIEDIAIAYGYDRINPLPVMGFSVGVPSDYMDFAGSVSKLMLGLDYTEAMNMYLTNEKICFENMSRRYDKASVVGIAYAKTEAITMLRTSVLPGLLQNLAQSLHERMPQRLFELGSVFSVEHGRVREGSSMAMVSEHSKANFSEMKSVVDALMRHLTVSKYSVGAYEDPAFIKGRCASVTINGQQAGVFGEIAPQVLESFRLEEPVVAAEIKIDVLRANTA